MAKTNTTPRPLRAVILAAGTECFPGEDCPMITHQLGDKRIIESVIENALHVVAPESLCIVIPANDHCVKKALADHPYAGTWQYVTQDQPQGTGHAVLQMEDVLGDFEGDLLILYADTPLFRPESIRGLLNRHRLRSAHLTLLSAVVDQALPYGRIIRDASKNIVDIVENTDASPLVRDIREINVGAYVAQVPALFKTLHALAPSPSDDEIRLTDCAYRIIHSGQTVESYQIYDQDEIVGINTLNDLEQAEFILKKRLLHPRRVEEHNLIKFGTGGWRAVIGEGFTMHNVRRLCQALANMVVRQEGESGGVLIGYDRRFLSDRAAEIAAEVFSGNNIKVTLLVEDAPTPLVTYATENTDAVMGLVFTASHNPPDWNGLKVFHADGSLLLDDETRAIEAEANALTRNDVVKIDLGLAKQSGIVTIADFTNDYVDAVESFIDMETIKKAGLSIIIDPMYGVGHLTMAMVFTDARCRVRFINERHDPLFGGRSPAPDFKALRLLMTHIGEGRYDFGLATDGDADRIALVDEQGRYVTINDVLLLLYWYMHEVRGDRGGVVRNLATTHLLDRLADKLGEQCYEVPVGFKHIAKGMVDNDALLGGESSGGLTIRGHILGKDGIFAAAIIAEMLAKTGETISELLEQVYAITGKLEAVEYNLPATPEMRIVVPQRIQALIDACDPNALCLGEYPIVKISMMDGTKFYFENDNWALLRFSGTEPVLRIFAEADSEAKAMDYINTFKRLVLEA